MSKVPSGITEKRSQIHFEKYWKLTKLRPKNLVNFAPFWQLFGRSSLIFQYFFKRIFDCFLAIAHWEAQKICFKNYWKMKELRPNNCQKGAKLTRFLGRNLVYLASGDLNAREKIPSKVIFRKKLFFGTPYCTMYNVHCTFSTNCFCRMHCIQCT